MAICSNCGAQVPDGAPFCGNCGAPQAAAPAQPAQPAQPMYAGGYRQQAQQAYDAAQGYGAPARPRVPFSSKVKGICARMKGEPTGPVNYGLLKILSLVFALMFILFSVGLGAQIYYNRNRADSSEYQLSAKGIQKYDDVARATYRKDVKSLLKATNSSMKYSDMTDDQIKEYKKRIETSLDKEFEEYGFRYTMARFGCLVSPWFIWIGLIGLLASFVIWWLFGGRFKNISRTTYLPALYAALGVFVVLLLVNGLVATCYKS